MRALCPELFNQGEGFTFFDYFHSSSISGLIFSNMRGEKKAVPLLKLKKLILSDFIPLDNIYTLAVKMSLRERLNTEYFLID